MTCPVNEGTFSSLSVVYTVLFEFDSKRNNSAGVCSWSPAIISPPKWLSTNPLMMFLFDTLDGYRDTGIQNKYQNPWMLIIVANQYWAIRARRFLLNETTEAKIDGIWNYQLKFPVLIGGRNQLKVSQLIV